MSNSQKVLQKYFGFEDFRPGQQQAIDAVLSSQDTMVIMPTGGGKSLCFQIPAMVHRIEGDGPTIVVSPLVALMDDQASNLQGRGIAAFCLHSSQNKAQQLETFDAWRNNRVDLLYVSPERALTKGFAMMIQDAEVPLLAIDEAHCVSQWGHDFRPEYGRLDLLRELIDGPCIALTATATLRVRKEIVKHLGLSKPEVIQGSFFRPNLHFEVRQDVPSDAARIDALLEILRSMNLHQDGRGRGRAIVYTATRKASEKVAEALNQHGFRAGYYHAGRSDSLRQKTQRAYEVGRVPILVATNAFGMGIDQGNVRLVLHFHSPASVEAYYQEAGRAGRDGSSARCVLFHSPRDLVLQRRIQSNKSSAELKKAGIRMDAMLDYINTERCRQIFFSEYFTEELTQTQACTVCDVCRGIVYSPVDVRTVTPSTRLTHAETEIVVAAVDSLKKPVGRAALAKALRGSRAKIMRKYQLVTLPQHGQLKHCQEADIIATVDDLLQKGVLVRKGQKYPTLWMPQKPVRSKPSTNSSPRQRRSSTPYRAKRPPVQESLKRYRDRESRRLKWKPYMVFSNQVITQLDKLRPENLEELTVVRGLGPAKIERFGEDILTILEQHA